MNEESYRFIVRKLASLVLLYILLYVLIFSGLIYIGYKYYFKDKFFSHSVQQDSICLADNIYYESVGESERGQVAVATVTLNRLKHPNFAKTICGVVYERNSTCEFSWVCQNKLSSARFKDINWQRIHTMSEQIVLGNKKTLPELENALYYHAEYVKPFWAEHKKRIIKIGAHIFYE